MVIPISTPSILLSTPFIIDIAIGSEASIYSIGDDTGDTVDGDKSFDVVGGPC